MHLTAVIAIYWMAALSILSAADYFLGFWKKIDHASGSRRQRKVLSRRKAQQVRTVPPAA